jgi:hypothetical protein
MSERISIRGKGAELFFGDDPTPNPERPPVRNSVVPDARQTDSMQASKTADQQDRQTADQQDRQTARKQDSKTDSKIARQTDITVWALELIERLVDAMSQSHPVHNTFRYTQHDLDRLRDIIYELEVKRHIKTSRNDVMRLALAWILDDYREHGADSLIVTVLKEQRWGREP